MRLKFLTTLLVLGLISSKGMSGVGGIGGGSSGRTLEYAELVEILKSRNLDVQMPQFPFAGDFPGTHFIYIDGICHNQDQLETIKPFNVPVFGNESTQKTQAKVNLKSSRIIKTQDSDGVLQTTLIPLEHEIQIYKNNGIVGDDRNFRTFIGAKKYKIPECQTVRK